MTIRNVLKIVRNISPHHHHHTTRPPLALVPSGCASNSYAITELNYSIHFKRTFTFIHLISDCVRSQYLQPTVPQLGVGVALIGWVALQVVVILMQRKFGPRFFIPARFLPEKYDYYRAVIVIEGRVEPDVGGGTRRRADGSRPSLYDTCTRACAAVRGRCIDCLTRARIIRRGPDGLGAFASVRPYDDDSDAIDSTVDEEAPTHAGNLMAANLLIRLFHVKVFTKGFDCLLVL